MRAAHRTPGKSGGTAGRVFPINEFRERFSSLEEHLRNVQGEVEELQTLTSKLLDVGVAISAELDLYALLSTIVNEAKELLKADRGTLYLVDPKKDELFFHVTDEKKIKEVRLPINEESIAGYVASTGKWLNLPDVYKISKSESYTFNKSIDRKTGYRTRSMLTVPMLNHKGTITGVVQLMNKLTGDLAVPFSERDQNILMSLASQAAVAIENAQLYKEVAELLEGFIKYSTSAIDGRDPATAGHSRRVAMYSVATARAMGGFSEEEIMEINYAAWLHDVGKIAVREHILVKENKLYPEQLAKLRERFDSIKFSIQKKYMLRKLKLLGKTISHEILEDLDRQMHDEIEQIEDDMAFIERVNKPGFTPPEQVQRIERISRLRYTDPDGKSRPFLEHDEAQALKVVKGNLTDEEMKIMQAHAASTAKFLEQIPFTTALKNVPRIAASHHEKLDGSGYPNRLKEKDIPIQAKIIAIMDIYDAITAQDRPYKPAIPVDRALKIIEFDIKDKKLDAEVFRVFLEHKIYELADDEETHRSVFENVPMKGKKADGMPSMPRFGK